MTKFFEFIYWLMEKISKSINERRGANVHEEINKEVERKEAENKKLDANNKLDAIDRILDDD